MKKQLQASSGQIHKVEEIKEFTNPLSSLWKAHLCYEGVFSVKFLLVYCISNYSEEVVQCGDQEYKF